MDKKEEEARKLCALMNWSSDCEDCCTKDWNNPGDYSWHRSKDPLFDKRKCSTWINYLPQPIKFFTKLKIKILLRLGRLHG